MNDTPKLIAVLALVACMVFLYFTPEMFGWFR